MRDIQLHILFWRHVASQALEATSWSIPTAPHHATQALTSLQKQLQRKESLAQRGFRCGL